MAYNILKGTVDGSVDQHADQEIGGVKVFKNTVSASVFWDTDAQSPCATLKDVGVRSVAGKTKNGILIYDADGDAKTSYDLTYVEGKLNVKTVNANVVAGSAAKMFNIPTDKFDGLIGAYDLQLSNGLHNVRGDLQVKAAAGISVDEDGVSLQLEKSCGLALKSNKLTIDISQVGKINDRGQNASDDDLLLLTDVSAGSVKSTTLKNIYDGYLKLKVPHAAGTIGDIQFKGSSEFDSCSNLKYDSAENTLKVEGKINGQNVIASNKLVCEGSVYNSIRNITEPAHTVSESDYTLICDTYKNKITVMLPPPCNSRGRVLIIKKVNSDRYKLNSQPVEITCEESKIDLSDSVILKSNYSTRMLQSDGNTWHVINKIG